MFFMIKNTCNVKSYKLYIYEVDLGLNNMNDFTLGGYTKEFYSNKYFLMMCC